MKKILAALGVVLLGCLIYLIIGGIFSGIGVPMWVTGVIALAIFLPLAVGCIAYWDKLYPVYRSGGGMATLRLSKPQRVIYKQMMLQVYQF